MAEQIKFRLTKARAGLTLAILALVAGVTDRADSTTHAELTADQVTASPAAFDAFLKLDGITGATRTAFQKIENTFAKFDAKLDTAVAQIYQKFEKYDTAQKLDKTFLTTAAAGAEFLTPAAANGSFLAKGGTAANSTELGGKTADAFVQGAGNVVSGYAVVTAANNVDNPLPLIASPDGTISVSVYDDSGLVTLSVQNTTSTDLPAVQDTDGQTSAQTLTAGEFNPLVIGSGAAQTTIQILPAGSSTDVITLTVSVDAVVGQASIPVVAQMLVGSSS